MAVRVVRFSIMAGAMLAFAACGGGGGPAATAGPVGATPLATCVGSGGTAVNVADLSFIPTSQTVAVGSTVTWTNQDGAAHTVTFDAGPDCGSIGQGESVSRTFDSAGSFAYHCEFHSTMRGTIVVQ